MTAGPAQTTRIAVLCAIAFLVANAAFYFLSDSYFESHHEIVHGASVPTYSPDQVAHIRSVFAMISGAIAAVSLVAGLAPRAVGHAVPALLGVVNLIGGIAVIRHGLSGALAATLVITGGLMPILAWYSYHRSRAAWGFLGAICGVLALASLFGAPKLRGVLDVSLWTTMILPGLYTVAAGTLYVLRHDYVDRAPVPAA
ncbi:MAG TPA: hypothetical protein VFT22_15480 [Kofleriaceae bacterium]|nr:hypothetical protein [Kofleriaceae bacterium]